MLSPTSSLANASYRLLNFAFWLELLLVYRLESVCRPVVWRLFVIIGVCLLRWLWFRICWLSVVVAVCRVSCCAPVVSSRVRRGLFTLNVLCHHTCTLIRVGHQIHSLLRAVWFWDLFHNLFYISSLVSRFVLCLSSYGIWQYDEAFQSLWLQ